MPRARGMCVRSPRGSLGIIAALALVVGACGNAKTVVSNTGNVQGVTSSQIIVGGVASLTGPIPATSHRSSTGSMPTSTWSTRRGVWTVARSSSDSPRRRLEPLQDTDQVRTLVEQDHVFAVVGVGTPSFAGASYLAANNVPTFGYTVSTDWADRPSLFGSEGSFIDFTRPGPEPTYLAERLHAKKVGILAYNVGGSGQGCEGVAYEMQRFHVRWCTRISRSRPAGRPHDRRQPDARPRRGPRRELHGPLWQHPAVSHDAPKTAWGRSRSTG